ncbi:MAG: response regulator [Deltaproteobacteria bacterium]|nr:response regulator [Deltaproteobacteria bacterium]TLN04569.1 MAG: response regulator [bacterium]
MQSPGVKILIIDDDALFRNILSDIFREYNFTVVTAENGLEGIKTFLAEAPDVAIVDLVMPMLGGVSTCLEIARLAGDTPPILILLTSMFKGAPHEHEAPEMGARVHIPKSTNPLDIVIIVEQLLDRKKFQQ